MKQFLIIKICFLIFCIIAFVSAANAVIEVRLVSPLNGTTDVARPVVLEFRVTDSYYAYEIIIDDNSNFSSPEVVLYGEGYTMENTIDTAFGLAEGTTYYWYARALTMSFGWMRSNETWHFTTEGCFISSPVMTLPENGTIEAIQPVYLEWEEVPDAIEYRVQVDDNDDFSSPEYDFMLPGTGTCVFSLDEGVTYYWRVKAIKDGCSSDWSPAWSFVTQDHTNVNEAGSYALPESYQLYSNYPNPFNATTVIAFSLPEKQNVTIEIYNILGEKIETSLCRQLPAGNWSVTWNGSGYPSGIYYYRITAGQFIESNKMVLLK